MRYALSCACKMSFSAFDPLYWYDPIIWKGFWGGGGNFERKEGIGDAQKKVHSPGQEGAGTLLSRWPCWCPLSPPPPPLVDRATDVQKYRVSKKASAFFIAPIWWEEEWAWIVTMRNGSWLIWLDVSAGPSQVNISKEWDLRTEEHPTLSWAPAYIVKVFQVWTPCDVMNLYSESFLQDRGGKLFLENHLTASSLFGIR